MEPIEQDESKKNKLSETSQYAILFALIVLLLLLGLWIGGMLKIGPYQDTALGSDVSYTNNTRTCVPVSSGEGEVNFIAWEIKGKIGTKDEDNKFFTLINEKGKETKINLINDLHILTDGGTQPGEEGTGKFDLIETGKTVRVILNSRAPDWEVYPAVIYVK